VVVVVWWWWCGGGGVVVVVVVVVPVPAVVVVLLLNELIQLPTILVGMVCVADVCTSTGSAQGNTKGWGHTNKLQQYKHTKYKPRLNIKTHTRPNLAV